jgi:hypothetical protein
MTAANRSTEKPKVSVKGGRLLATSCADLYLVLVGTNAVTETAADQLAGPLIRKLGKGLSKPGISRDAVFGPNPKRNAYAYSVDPTNPERMIREDAAGNRTVGRMINGVFRKIATGRGRILPP